MSTDPALHIRSYNYSDRNAVIALARELQAHEYLLFNRMKQPHDIGEWYIDELQRQCRDSAGEIIVLETAGRIAGYATILTAVKNDAYDEIAYTYALVGDIAITRKLRGKGHGKTLLAECENRARKAGAKWLRINVLAANQSALGTYRSFGFNDHLIELEKPLNN